MAQIELIVPKDGTRGWHRRLADRLAAAGHSIGVRPVAVPPSSLGLDLLLAAEQRFLLMSTSELVAPAEVAPAEVADRPDLRIDLTGTEPVGDRPLLGIEIAGGQALDLAAAEVAAGGLPDITVTLDRKPFDLARPMLDNRVVVTRGLEDVLARTISILDASARQVLLGRRTPAPHMQAGARLARHARRGLAMAYLTTALPGLTKKIARRLAGRGHDHWRVGYRFVGTDGVAETGDLSGPTWTVLSDDGSRFYADPFPFIDKERMFVFVEDYEHARGKGIISVARIAPDGSATAPEPVLEEDYHLSYPQVFVHNGQIWMLPEASASKSLVLYRAKDFPRGWTRHAVLFEGRDLSDATFFEHRGKLWLIASERDGAGSAADLMVVFHADRIEGPWTPHPDNPVVIDRAGARPGGAVIRRGDRLFLPVQDGTEVYGGGLGLSEIEELSPDRVRVATPTPVNTKGFWPYPAIHTLNRAGHLEAIDGIVER